MQFRQDLGEYDGRPYFLSIRARPDLDAPEEFAVVCYYNDPRTEERVEIARIDTAHGYTHFDRLYRRDQPKERVEMGLWEAVSVLRDNWRQYAESFERP